MKAIDKFFWRLTTVVLSFTFFSLFTPAAEIQAEGSPARRANAGRPNHANAAGAMDISVSPDSLSESLAAGDSSTQVLTLTNSGIVPLNFSVTALIDAAANGPDQFGYRWIDSDHPEGPEFEWIEVSSVGTRLDLGNNDFAEIALPFSFPFYDDIKDSITISSNGFLTFGPDGIGSFAPPPPDPREPNDFIAPFWEYYLNPDEGGAIYYFGDVAQNRFIVQYHEVVYDDGDRFRGPYTFQVILTPEGNILFQYLRIATALGRTVGIENSDGSDALTIAYNSNYLHDNLAIAILRPPSWLGLDPASGIVPAGSSLQLSAKFNASGLVAGNYRAKVLIVAGDSSLIVPAHLEVMGEPDITVFPSALDFGEVFVGATVRDTLFVTNTGRALLTVNAITSDHADFAVDTTSFALFPDWSQPVVVSFSPGTATSISGTLTIMSDGFNQPAITVSLSGEGLLPPVISISPDSFVVNLMDSDTTSELLSIGNVGAHDLVWTLGSTLERDRLFNGLRVLFTSAQQPEFRSEVERFGAQASVYSGGVGSATLDTVDVLVIDDFLNATLTEMSIINNWIRNGGGLIIDGESDRNDFNHVLSGSGISYLSPDNVSGITSDITPHPVTNNLSQYEIARFSSASLSVSGNALAVIRDGNGVPNVAVAPLGTGRVVAIVGQSLDSFTFNLSGHLDMGLNAVTWLAGRHWLSFDPTAGTVIPGNTEQVTISIEARNLIDGVYDARLRLASNDPVNSLVTVPIHLQFAGKPEIALSDTSLEFGEVFVGGSKSRTLVVYNLGTDTLMVSAITSDQPDFTAAATSFDLNPGEEHRVTITFTPSTPDSIAGILTITSDDPDEPDLTIALSGKGLQPPVITVSPESFEAALAAGDTTYSTLTLGNTGAHDLDFTIVIVDGSSVREIASDPYQLGYRRMSSNDARGPAFNRMEISGKRFTGSLGPVSAGPAAVANRFGHLDLQKGEVDSRGGIAVINAAGGPDNFGYHWIDSDDPGGPVFNWVDISAIGTSISLGDDNYQEVALPFVFPFYGEEKNSIKIGSNGYLTFGSNGTAYSNDPIPNAVQPNDLIAPFWDDLNPAGGGAIHHYSDAGQNRFIVQYTNIPTYSGGALYTFQVILNPAGVILFQYLNMPPPVNSATVGIENNEGSDGLQIAFNTNYIHNGLAIRIATLHEWLSVTPMSGTIAPGASQDLLVEFNAARLNDGAYQATILVSSTDPLQPELALPAHLQVTGTPAIAASDSALDFGSVVIGASQSRVITVANQGSDTLNIGAVTVDYADFAADPGSFSLTPDEIREVTITYAPSTAGSISALLAIASDDPNQPTVTIPLNGEGLLPPTVTIMPDSFDLALMVGDSATHTFTLGNSGTGILDWAIHLEDSATSASSNSSTLSLTPLRFDNRNQSLRAWSEQMTAAKVVDEGKARYSTQSTTSNLLSGVRVLFTNANRTSLRAALETRGARTSIYNGEVTPATLDTIEVFVIDDFFDPTSSEITVVSDWVRNGGGLVIDGYTDRSQFGSIIAGSGIVYFSATVVPGVTADITPHIVTSGISEFEITDGLQLLVFDNARGLIRDIAGNPHVAVAPLGKGRVVVSGYVNLYDSRINLPGHATFGLNAVAWAAARPIWVTADMNSGTLDPGASQEVSLQVKTANLIGGDYDASVVITSNDPVTPVASLPIHLQLTGIPQLTVSDSSFDFGVVFVDTSVTDTLVISNKGTDVLTVNNISTDHADYAVTPAAFSLNPAESREVMIIFTPGSIGPKSATLTIVSNDPERPSVALALNGTGVFTPQITVAPASFETTLISGDSTTEALTIGNTGLGDLHWQLEVRRPSSSSRAQMANRFRFDQQAVTARVQDLGATEVRWDQGRMSYRLAKYQQAEGVAAHESMQQTLLAGNLLHGLRVLFNTAHSFYQIELEIHSAQTSVYTGEILASTLDTVDVFVIDDSFNPTTTERTVVNNWIRSGGKVIVQGQFFLSQFNTILQGSGISYISPDPAIGETDDITPHAVTTGIAAYDVRSGSATLSASGNAMDLIRDLNGQQVVAAAELEQGRAVAIAGTGLSDSQFNNIGHRELGLSAVAWLTYRSWLVPAVLSGTVAPGASARVDLDFISSNLIDGEYDAKIAILSNDPVAPTVAVPAHLRVVGIPRIALSDTAIFFGETLLGFSLSDTLVISNRGTGTLTITDVSSDHADYTVESDSLPLSLQPGERHKVPLTFRPSTGGLILGQLHIASNDPAKPGAIVHLQGRGLELPRITLSQDSFSVALNAGEHASDSLTIGNVGIGNLTWSLDFELLDSAATSENGPRARLSQRSPVAPRTRLTARLQELGATDIHWQDDKVSYRMAGAQASDANAPDLASLFTSEVTGLLTGVRVLLTASTKSAFQAALEAHGAQTSIHTGEITPATLDTVEVLVLDNLAFNLAPVQIVIIKNWINNGGRVLIDTDGVQTVLDVYNNIISGSGISLFDAFQPVNGLTTDIAVHPVTARIASYETAIGSNTRMNVGGNAFTIIRATNGSRYAAVAPLGAGRIVAIGDESLDNFNLDSPGHLRLGLNAVAWLAGRFWFSAAPLSGVLAPADSETVMLNLDAAALNQGSYQARLFVTSNDTAKSEIIVPVDLQVAGVPGIAVPVDSLDFGLVLLGTTASETLVISNPGSAALTIHSIASDHSDFSAAPGSFNLAPNRSQKVAVRFTPSAAAVRAATLTILSNAPNAPSISIPLNGEGSLQSAISVAPDSLAAILAVGDSTTELLTISNNGPGTLAWSIDLDVLGASMSNLLQGIRVLFTSASETTLQLELEARGALTSVYRGGITPATLDTVDLLLVDDFVDPTTSEGTAVRNWIQAGGGLIIEGLEDRFAFNVMIAGSGISYLSSSSYGGVTRNITPHPVSEMIAEYEIVPGTASALDAVGDALIVIRDAIGNPHVAVAPLGAGRVVAIGAGSFNNGRLERPGHLALALNAAAWLSDRNWLAVAPSSGIIAAGNSASATVSMNARNLVEGFYHATLSVASNDTANALVEVPVHLQVTSGVPEIATSDDTLRYGVVFLGYELTKDLVIHNAGTDTLTISDITSDNPNYTVDLASFTLIPRQNQSVRVTFAPSAVGSASGALTIFSNDPDEPTTTVVLQGEGAMAPEIAVTPDSLSENLFVGETLEQTLTISNNGGYELRLSFRFLGFTTIDWVRISPSRETVAVGESKDFILTFDATRRAAGEYDAELEISSNDPVQPTLIIPVHMRVSGERVFVTFNLDMRALQRLGLFRPEKEMRPVVSIFTGDFLRDQQLTDAEGDSIWSVRLQQRDSTTVSYVFAIDPDGNGRNNAGEWVYERNGDQGGRTLTLNTGADTTLAPVFFDDRPFEAIVPSYAALVTRSFKAGDSPATEFIDGLIKTYLTLDLESLDRAALVAVRRYADNPGGDLPAGIAVIAKHVYWEIASTPTAANFVTRLTVDYSPLNGIVDASALRLLRRDDSSQPWQVLTTEVNLVNQTLAVASVSEFGQWTIGSTDAINPLESRLPGVVSNPNPPDGEVYVSERPVLSWFPGEHTLEYDIYLWPATENKPATPFAAHVQNTSYQVGTRLNFGAAYKWQIVSRNLDGETTGPEWSFTVRNLADLQVTVVQTPPEAFTGQSFEVSWQVTNDGAAATNVPAWHDRVYLSDNPEFSNLTAQLIGDFQNLTFLLSGESYTNSATFTMPQAAVGDRYIFVVTDARLQLGESDESNNRGRNTTAINVNLTPPPDLQVTSLSFPGNAFSGDTLEVSWTVTNNGAGPTAESRWFDAVYLSLDSTFNRDTATQLGNAVRHDGVLASGESYNGSQTIVLPFTVFNTRAYLHVVSDIQGSVFEFTHEDNNVATRSISLTLKPPADLVVTNVVAPGSGASGKPIPVKWIVENQGPGRTYVRTWTDRIYLTTSDTLDVDSAILLGNFGHSGFLEPGESYEVEREVYLPNGISGDHYLFVAADASDQVFEYIFEDNNVTRSTGSFPAELSPWVDLHVTSVQGPHNATAGSLANVTWNVRNEGVATELTALWRDVVYVSQSPVWNASAATRLTGFSRNDSLSANEEYSVSRSARLPADLKGTYYFYVQTDADNGIFEHTDENNNISRSDSIIVAPYPPVDLIVASFSTPDNGFSGTPVELSYSVTNAGQAATLRANWSDEIYLSPDAELNSSDVRLATIARRTALGAGQSYARLPEVVLPNGASGDYYFILSVDAKGEVGEIDNGNNVAASTAPIHIALTPSPDLQIAAFNAPSEGTSGQPVTVEWTVTNNGIGETPGSVWYDAVYLSQNLSLEWYDPRLGTFQRSGTLQPGESYSASMEVTIPIHAAGTYYLIVQTDSRDEIFELEAEINNTQESPIFLTLPPPSDLIVTSVSLPDSAMPGDSVAVSYTLQNIGANPATGWMSDAVYFSSDGQWDIDDPLLGLNRRFVNLTPGTSLRQSLKVSLAQTYALDEDGNISDELPGVTPGDYLALVRTDIRNNIRENDDTNNTGVSSDSMSVEIPQLVLEVPSTTTVTNSKPAYYRVEVGAGFDLRLTLTGDGADGINELYAAFERTPTLSDFDYAGTKPFSANQQLLIPSTQSGTYYVMLATRADQPQHLTVLAEALSLSILSITPDAGGAGGRVTCTLTGAGFRDSTRVFLRVAPDSLWPAKMLEFVNTTKLKLRWDLTNVALGSYDVIALNTDNSQTELTNGFIVEPLQELNMAVYKSIPTSIGIFGGNARFEYAFENTSNADIPYLESFVIVPKTIVTTVKITSTENFIRRSTLLPDSLENLLGGVKDYREIGDLIFIPFIAKDLAVGEVARFNCVFDVNVIHGTLSVRVVARIVGRDRHIDGQLAGLEIFRMNILQNPTLYTPQLVELANNRTAFLDSALQTYQMLGLIDSEDIEDRLDLFGGSGFTSLQQLENRIKLQSALLYASQNGTLPSDCVQIFILLGCAAAIADCLIEIPGLPVLGWFLCGWGLGNSCFADLLLGSVGVIEPGIESCIGIASGITCVVKEIVCDPLDVPIIRSLDPNDIQGPVGFGDEKWISMNQNLPYTIRFENDPEQATAPAQEVTITQELDGNLDPRSFRLGSLGFGSFTFEAPPNRSYYTTRLDVSDSLGVLVEVNAGIDVISNEVFWNLRSVDPQTGQRPTNPLVGFLPINDSTGVGQGFVTYTVRPKSDLQSGDIVNAQASIVFDVNDPIDTPSIFNTVDAVAPTSRVDALPDTVSATSLMISWSATDDSSGSGVQNYALYSAVDDGPFQPFAGGILDRFYEFEGELGHTYRFFTIAKDNAGNLEPLKTEAEATVTIGTPAVIYKIAGAVEYFTPATSTTTASEASHAPAVVPSSPSESSLAGQPVSNVDVIVTGDRQDTTRTDVSGAYNVSGILPGLSLQVRPEKTGDLDAFTVTCFDAALIAQHAAGLNALDSLQQKAADVDEDGNVLFFDAALTCRFAVGLEPFNENDQTGAWRFVDPMRSYPFIQSDRLDQNYTALVLGDVDASWQPDSSAAGLMKATASHLSFVPEPQWSQNRKELTTSVAFDGEMAALGLDLEMSFDPTVVRFIEAVCPLAGWEIASNNFEEGKLRLGLFSTKPCNEAGEIVQVRWEVVDQNADHAISMEHVFVNREAQSASQLKLLSALPKRFALLQNYPNPFNPSTTIRFDIPQVAGGTVHTRLAVYNVIGQVVKVLVDEKREPGYHQVVWDGKNDAGVAVATGVYFYTITAGDFKARKKLLLVK